MQADVQGLMRGELGNWLAEQSDMRDAAQKKAFDRWFYGGIALLPVFAFLWFMPLGLFDLKLFAAGAAILGVGAWGYKPIQEAKKAIKVGINEAIARDLGINYDADVEPGVEFNKARSYGLVPKYDRDAFEDCWYGELGGHAFNLYEAHLEERKGSGKNRRWVTVFRGAIISVPFGRAFRSTTLLQRKGKHNRWLGLGGVKDVINLDGHRMQYVDQVHPQFEDVFEVFSDDQVEARVLIHPSYVEHLIALEKAFHGKSIRALFFDQHLVVVVESDNMFESGSMKAEEDNRRAQETADQFAALARLIMAINQTERGKAAPIMTKPDNPGITEGVREATPRRVGGFGRKGL
ncbi:hypothetical protein EH31_00390 [Erythrobacter longus]|uniref:DUF3137 domain-containing protein n=1 Tax=Erythrobacter longus TaxID=1044 RepID=A0A074MEI5_ERYLO|nr:DUF3137 domain-containing protein [Erythrobacter longus]KEO91155.1 hypothetical protein EH31_00390 [Erythrobacter longus]